MPGALEGPHRFEESLWGPTCQSLVRTDTGCSAALGSALRGGPASWDRAYRPAPVALPAPQALVRSGREVVPGPLGYPEVRRVVRPKTQDRVTVAGSD
jgi:hypothetical protein